ncbi:tRNA (guanosine(37)-N1)-methyltransferase TrmD [Lactimicrobium massiliense]|uniref:tRNA (guanosine(37)-N1)-methyltransferase TrmD n=1 Tax=Lactimicrobium massiliense TaxID=2161814 RepID=UPI000D54EAA5|nr:tRNA (guanosine(37)-N1)-methyltransferase TrmD [Lactimicrobium massiliense]
MKQITVLTMFPEYFDSFLNGVLVQRARTKGICQIRVVDIRDYADGSYRHLDDSPCGGGPGMIMKCEPVIAALRANKTEQTRSYIMDPGGQTLSQKLVHDLSKEDDLLLLAGHYEGLDERIYEECDGCLSIGDYILSGGELAAQVIIDSIIRLQEGVLANDSTVEESFETDRLEYPQYTRPVDFEGRKVPDVLLSGNHAMIKNWRLAKAYLRTAQMRPDLIAKKPMTKAEEKALRLFLAKNEKN